MAVSAEMIQECVQNMTYMKLAYSSAPTEVENIDCIYREAKYAPFSGQFSKTASGGGGCDG